MEDLNSVLGCDINEVENLELSDGYEPLKSGVYDATIKEAFIFRTNSGAKMVKMIFDVDGTEIKQYECIGKKDGSINNIGMVKLKNLISATGVSNPAIKQDNQVSYKDKVDGSSIIGIIGKQVKACVREVFDDNQETFKQSNEIEAFTDMNGINGSIQDTLDKFRAKIEKTPIKIVKVKSGGGTKSAPTKEATSAEDYGF